MPMPPTCMWAEELSLVRKETSSALSRSMCPWAMGLTYPPMRALATALLVAALLAGCGGDDGETDPGGFDAARAFADLEAQVEIGPRPAGSAANRENAELIAKRLREAGIEDVLVQRPWRNVVGTIPG